MSLSADDRSRVLDLAARGYSRRAIAARIGQSKSAVDRAIRADARRTVKQAEREPDAAALEAERKRKQNARAQAYRERRRAIRQAARVPAPVAEPVTQPPLAQGPGSRSLVDVRPHRAAPGPGRDIQTGLEGVLNRNERRREATAAALAAGLDREGMACVRILDADGEETRRTVFDPIDSADLARASRLTGVPVELLARAAHDRDVLERLAAGVRQQTQTPPKPDAV